MIVRTFKVGEEEMPDVGRESREIAETHFPEITWEHSHVVVDSKGVVRTYCVYGAPSPELVREHARMLGKHTIDELHEIAGDVTPTNRFSRDHRLRLRLAGNPRRVVPYAHEVLVMTIPH